MARGLPSMTALLGLLAVAGYQNRDKIGEMLGNRGTADTPTPRDVPEDSTQNRRGGLDSILSGFGGGAAGGGVGSVISGGLSELTDRFKQNGHSETVNSWVSTGANKQVAPRDLEQAIGPDVLDDLTAQTGLSRDELLSRLSRELPDAVDKYTPQGRVPADGELI